MHAHSFNYDATDAGRISTRCGPIGGELGPIHDAKISVRNSYRRSIDLFSTGADLANACEQTIAAVRSIALNHIRQNACSDRKIKHSCWTEDFKEQKQKAID
jgi:hypothetical protein